MTSELPSINTSQGERKKRHTRNRSISDTGIMSPIQEILTEEPMRDPKKAERIRKRRSNTFTHVKPFTVHESWMREELFRSSFFKHPLSIRKSGSNLSPAKETKLEKVLSIVLCPVISVASLVSCLAVSCCCVICPTAQDVLLGDDEEDFD